MVIRGERMGIAGGCDGVMEWYLREPVRMAEAFRDATVPPPTLKGKGRLWEEGEWVGETDRGRERIGRRVITSAIIYNRVYCDECIYQPKRHR